MRFWELIKWLRSRWTYPCTINLPSLWLKGNTNLFSGEVVLLCGTRKPVNFKSWGKSFTICIRVSIMFQFSISKIAINRKWKIEFKTFYSRFSHCPKYKSTRNIEAFIKIVFEISWYYNTDILCWMIFVPFFCSNTLIIFLFYFIHDFVFILIQLFKIL